MNKKLFPLLRDQWLSIAVGLLLINGILLCLAHYFTFRSFWLDEAFIALNLKTRPFHGLFTQLEYSQHFPRAYLSVIWAIQWILGYDFWSLRLLPLLFMVGALSLWAKLLWDEFSRGPKIILLIALLLFFTNHYLYYYAAELKQYSADLFWSAFGFYFAKRVFYFQNKFRSPKEWWSAVALVFPIMLSMTYIFILAAAGLAYLFNHEKNQLGSALKFLLLLVLLGIPFLIISYRIDIQFSDQGTILTYWRHHFIGGDTLYAWFHSVGKGFFRITGRWWSYPATPILSALALLGIIKFIFFLIKKKSSSLMSGTGLFIVLILFCLATLKRYPLEYGRTALFFFPFSVVLITHGIDWLYGSSKKIFKLGGLGCIAFVLLLTVAWKIPTVSRSYYKFDHWENLNYTMETLDLNVSDVVVYGSGGVAQVKSYPSLPLGFTFAFHMDYNFSQPWPEKTKRLIDKDFYYLVAHPNDELDKLKAQLPNYDVELVVSHLYLFKRRSDLP